MANRGDVIEKRGDKYVVLSEDRSKELGSFDSEAEAKERLRQIEAAKAGKSDDLTFDGTEKVHKGVRRYDKGTIRKPRRDDSTGALLVEMSVTRAPAVFEYRNADGSVRREFRPASEVFSKDNMERMARSPITLGHPPVRVTTRNVRKYGVGHADGNIRVEDDHAIVGAVVTDEEAIAALDRGMRDTSCGYDCDLVMKSGVFVDSAGVRHPYDGIQIGHRNNHHAFCQDGRAGSTRVLMDGLGRMDAIQIIEGEENMPTEPTKDSNRDDFFFPAGEGKARVRISDNMDVELPVEQAALVADALAAGKNVRRDLREKAVTLEAERDDFKKKAEDADKALEDATKPEDLLAAVDARIELQAKAQPFFSEDEWKELAGKTDAEIKKAAVAKAKPDLKLDEKPDGYVDAAFDLLESATDRGDANVQTLGNAALGAGNTGGGETDAQKRVDAAMDKDNDKWKHTVPGGITQDGKTVKPEPRTALAV